MSTRSLTRRQLYLAALGALAAAAIGHSPLATADPSSQSVVNYAQSVAPAVCYTLDDSPTLPGVSGVLTGVQNDSGFTGRDAAWVVVYAVTTKCSRHLALLQRFVATYAPAQSGAAV
jgi:hypothetical protein